MEPVPEFLSALAILTRHKADFIVVGGVAAVLWGAPVSTFDLDILYRQASDNVERLGLALREMGAVYRDPAGRLIEPDSARLAMGGHHLLTTRFGPLDVLATIGKSLSYDDLVPRTCRLDLREAMVLVLDLRTIIETKEQAGRSKDLLMLPILRQTLQMSES
ncbi:MAG TPA: hypothetical protein VHR45_09495 [Thermoanaerobaculia bacterium]|nr:hypothetical protein [Thermoanaerobaculia bacterium]